MPCLRRSVVQMMSGEVGSSHEDRRWESDRPYPDFHGRDRQARNAASRGTATLARQDVAMMTHPSAWRSSTGQCLM